MLTDLTEPFAYEFFRNAMVASTLIGALCGLIGVFVVLRRMSYIGHGLAHSVFGGAAVSYVLNLNFYVGAGMWGFLSAILINVISRRRKLEADAVIGIVTTTSFAIGVAIISQRRSYTRNFDAALFGNVLGVTRLDLLVIACAATIVSCMVFVLYKQLMFVTFDPNLARVYGVHTGAIDVFFSLGLAATVVVSTHIVGVTLIAAAIVIPPVIARLLTNSFPRLLALSTLLGAAIGSAGMYASYQLDMASGAAIVILAACVFSVVLIVTNQWRGLPRESDVSGVPVKTGD